MSSCSNCGKKEEKLKLCSACKKTSYCSVDCQKAHWPKHKADCIKKPGSAVVPAEPAKEAEVLWEDQQRINMFGRLNLKSDELQRMAATLKEEIANLEDAATEAELVEADEGELYVQIGEVFVAAEGEMASSYANKRLDAVKTELKKISEEYEKSQEEMKSLKAVLYAKFGDAINLETDPKA
jgi:prefoldin subunit 4